MTNGQKAAILVALGTVMARHSIPIQAVLGGKESSQEMKEEIVKHGISHDEAHHLMVNEVSRWLNGVQ